MEDCSHLLNLYENVLDKYSCQPFVLVYPNNKKLNMQNLLSVLEGHKTIEVSNIDNYVVPQEFLDPEGKLTKKIEIVETYLINDTEGLILSTREKEKSVFFRDQDYLFLETEFIIVKIESVGDTYYLYVFSKEDSINAFIECINNKLQELGLCIGDLSLSKIALTELHVNVDANLAEFSLNNVTTRLKNIRGRGHDLQNDDTYNSLKDKPNAEIYRYLLKIVHPHSDLNIEKLTVSIRRNCFVHSYHFLTCSTLLSFVKTHIVPRATAKIPVHHPLGAYDNSVISDECIDVEDE